VTVQPFAPSWIRWYNAVDGSKVASADVGSYEKIPYGAQRAGEKHAQGKPPHAEHGQWQWGIACSRTSRTIGIDIDHPEHWAASHAADILGEDLDAIVTSRRVTPEGAVRSHIMVQVPGELAGWWPAQGQTAWGDVKSAGFTYVEGVHHTGTRYTATGRPWIVATEALMRALVAEPRKQRTGQGDGTTAGTWEDDNYEITGDSQLTADIMSMVANGLDEDQIHDRLNIILKPISEPWTPRQIETKISSAQRKVDEGERREREFWGAFHRGGYEGLVAELAERERAAAEAAEQGRQERQEVYATPEPDRPALAITYGNDQWLAKQVLGYGLAMGYAYAADTGDHFQRVGDHWERCPEDPCPSVVARVADLVPRPKDSNWDGKSPAMPGTAPDPEELDKKLYSYLHMSATSGRVAAKMRALWPNLEPRLREMDMDADGRVFWAGGTPYDLRTLETADVDPGTPHLLSAGYVPGTGETPLWDELNAAQWPDKELREYALNVLASVLRGGNKLLPNFKSDGNMGKTTRLMVLVDLLGSYAEQLPAQILTGRTGHDETFLRLKGKRLVWMDETPPASKIATEKLKNLSGGGKLTGRAVNGKMPVTFTMQHTLLLAGNDDLPLTDENVWAVRVRYLPIPGDRKRIGAVSRKIWDGHSGLSDAWKAEAPAVLWEMMQRASRVMADPSLTDMAAEALTPFAEAVTEQDHVARFVHDGCEPKGSTPGGQLYEAFVAWGVRNNLARSEIMTNTKFGTRLTQMGYPANKHSAGRNRPLSLKAGMFSYLPLLHGACQITPAPSWCPSTAARSAPSSTRAGASRTCQTWPVPSASGPTT
jgi:hypothetical protein